MNEENIQLKDKLEEQKIIIDHKEILINKLQNKYEEIQDEHLKVNVNNNNIKKAHEILKKRNISLQQNLQQITLMYQKLLSQSTLLSNDHKVKGYLKLLESKNKKQKDKTS